MKQSINGSLGLNQTLLELAAGGIDVIAARVADSCLDTMHLQALLKRFDLLHGGGLEERTRGVVELNEVDVAECAAAEIDQGFHLGIGVVDAVDHGELVGRAASGLLDIRLNRLVQTGERVLLDAGHKLVAGALNSGMERDGERELLGELRKTLDTGNDAAGGNGQMAGADGVAIRIVEHAKRFDGRVEVRERLALPHEDDAGDALIKIHGDVADLIDDLLRAEGAREAVEARRAERATHGAARLSRDADSELVFAGHADGLDRRAVAELKEILAGPVVRDLLDKLLGKAEGEVLRELFAQLFGDIGHLLKRRDVLGEDPFADLLCSKRGLAEFLDELGDFVGRQRADVAHAI